MEKYYFLFISLFSILAIAGTHFYIKNKLGPKHDNGLLWVAGAFLVWFVLAAYENGKPPHSKLYDMGRKSLSILNSVLFVYSLSYFKDSWYRVDKRLKNVRFSMLALVTLLLCLLSFIIGESWVVVDVIISVLIAILLSSSMAVTLQYREAGYLFIIPILTGIVLIYTQIFDKQFADYVHLKPLFDENTHLVFRMLSRPLLTFSFLLVAITWLGNNLEERALLNSAQEGIPTGAPGRQAAANRIVFFTNHPNQFKIFISLSTENIELNDAYFDFHLNEKKHKFLKDCAELTRSGEDIKRKDFPTDNFEQDINRLVSFLNSKIQRNDYADKLLRKEDLFVREDRGVYRLNFEKDQIIFKTIRV